MKKVVSTSIFLLIFSQLLWEGCTSPQKLCTPNLTQSCLCSGGTKGVQSCASDGGGWTKCNCSTPISDENQTESDSLFDGGGPDANQIADSIPTEQLTESSAQREERVGVGSCKNCTSNQICDPLIKQCVPNCTAKDFPGCKPGHTCDTRMKRCVCDQKKCFQQQGYGCNSPKNLCEPRCATNKNCKNGEVCFHGFCQKEEGYCKTHKDCPDSKRSMCHNTPGVIPFCRIPPEDWCKSDANCNCDLTKNKCVLCANDAHCGNAKCDLKKQQCQCTNTAECFMLNKKTACINSQCTKVKHCGGTPNGWKTSVLKGKGSLIWNVKVKSATYKEGCPIATSPKRSCQSDLDCQNMKDRFKNLFCRDGQCLHSIPDSFKTVTFQYYNHSGKFPESCDPGTNKCIMRIKTVLGLTRRGTGSRGEGEFHFCSPGKPEVSFWVKDTAGEPSNWHCP